MHHTNKGNDWFYNSAAWRKVRKVYYTQVYGLCELCSSAGIIVHHKTHLTLTNVYDDAIALNSDNLMLLCIECHNKEHMCNDLYKSKEIGFDENGNVIQRKKND